VIEAISVITTFDPPAPAEGKTIELSLCWYVRDYKVVAITNSTSLKPGMWITPAVAEKLAQTPRWRVSCADNSVISSLFSLIGGVKSAAAP
jgi:hypothetical protein